MCYSKKCGTQEGRLWTVECTLKEEETEQSDKKELNTLYIRIYIYIYVRKPTYEVTMRNSLHSVRVSEVGM